jgi:putative transcriptional regulator
MSKKDTKFGSDLLQALKEVKAHRRGEIALTSRRVDVISAQRVKAIRTSLAKSPKDFERRFGIPARTIEGWEQGRKLDVASSILMSLVEQEPNVVENAVAKARSGIFEAQSKRFIEPQVDRVIQRIRPVENIVERYVDVPIDRVIERIRPVENLVERQVDVNIERVIERVRPVQTLVERYLEPTAENDPSVTEIRGPFHRTAQRDDLKLIEGIGPKIEELFHSKGIYSFAQLSDLEVRWISNMLREAGPRFTIHDPATWPNQAKMASAGNWDELKRYQVELTAGRTS